MKKCRKCFIEKDENEFALKRHVCRECLKLKQREYYKINRAKLLEDKKNYAFNNKEIIRERQKNHRNGSKRQEILDKKKKYYQENKEEIKEERKGYFEEYRNKPENKTRQKEHSDEYYINNKGKILKRCKEYDNKPENKEKRRLYSKSRRNIVRQRQNEKRKEPAFRLRHNVSCAIRRALKKLNIKKGNPTWSKLSYTPQQLKIHLENQFEEWMSWENYRFV